MTTSYNPIVSFENSSHMRTAMSTRLDKTSSTQADLPTSYTQIMAMVYKLLQEIGINSGTLALDFNKDVENSTKAADSISTKQADNSRAVQAAVQDADETESKCEVSPALKWINFALSALVALATCPFSGPMGFVLCAGLLAAQGTGEADKATNFIANLLQKIDPKLSDEWAKVLANVILIAAVIVVSKGCSAGDAKIADAVATKPVAPEGIEMNAVSSSNLADQAASSVQKEEEALQEEVQEEAKETPAWRKRLAEATRISGQNALVFTTAFSSTNLAYNFIKACGGSEMAADIGSVVVNLAITAAAFSRVESAGPANVLKRLFSIKTATLLQKVVLLIQSAGNLASGVAGIYSGAQQLALANIKEQIADLKKSGTLIEGDNKILDRINELESNQQKSIQESYHNTYNADYAATGRAVAEILG